MTQIMVRHANDGFHALQIANGMEEAGGIVISIVNNGILENCQGISYSKFLVFARVENETMARAVDVAIEKQLKFRPL